MLTTTDLHEAAYSILTHDPNFPCKVTSLIETRGPSTPRNFIQEDPRNTVTLLLAVAIQTNACTLEEARIASDPYGYILSLCDDEAKRYAHRLIAADYGISWFAVWRQAYTQCGLLISERAM